MGESKVEVVSNPMPVKGQTACDACGRYHGSVMLEIYCLRAELGRERAQRRQRDRRVEELDAKIASASKALK